MEEQDLKDREKFITEQDKKRAKEIRDSQVFGSLGQSRIEQSDIVNTGPYGFNETRGGMQRNRNFNSNTQGGITPQGFNSRSKIHSLVNNSIEVSESVADQRQEMLSRHVIGG